MVPPFSDDNQRILQERRQRDFGTVTLKPKEHYGFTGRFMYLIGGECEGLEAY